MKPWERAPGAVKLGRRDSKITFRRMVGSSYKQRWLYITTIENLFFFFFQYRLGPGGGCYDILQDKRGMKKNQRGPLQHLSLS